MVSLTGCEQFRAAHFICMCVWAFVRSAARRQKAENGFVPLLLLLSGGLMFFSYIVFFIMIMIM